MDTAGSADESERRGNPIGNEGRCSCVTRTLFCSITETLNKEAACSVPLQGWGEKHSHKI